MENTKVFLMLMLVVVAGISMVGSVSAADTGNNTTINATNSTGLADTPLPKLGDNNNNTGKSNYTGPQSNTTNWTYTTTSTVKSYSPVAIGTNGTVYVGDSSTVYAMTSNGTLKWKYTPGGTLLCITLGSDGMVYIGTSTGVFELADNGTTYTVVWSTTSYKGYSITFVNGTMYAASSTSITAFSSNKTVLWTSTLAKLYVSLYATSIAVGSDGTIYTTYTGSVYATNPDGSLKWNDSISGTLSSVVIGSDGTLYVGTSAGALYALNPSNGSIIWNITLSGVSANCIALGSDGILYVGGNTWSAFAAVSSNGTVLWTYSTAGYVMSAPVIGADGTIYVSSSAGTLYALNPDGTLKWKYTSTSSTSVFYNLAIGSDGTLYALNSANTVYAFRDPAPTAGFTADSTSSTGTLTVKFEDNSSYATTWLWDFGDGTNSTEENPTHTYSTPGTYTVKLTVTNNNGLNSDEETKTDYITVNWFTPVAGFTTNATTGTGSLTVKFTDTSSYATSWLWDFGDGTTSTDENPTHTYTTPGTYTVTLTAANPGGNDSITQTNLITVYWPAPIASFTTNATTGNNSLAVQFTDTSSNATSWSWNFGDGSTSTEQNPTHIYTTPGTYTVTLTVTGPGGSNSTILTDYITVLDTIAPTVSANQTTGNYTTGLNVTLSSDDPNATIYYTTDGSDPTTSSSVYRGPISIADTTTLKFIAVDSVGNVSPVQSETYTIGSSVYLNITSSESNPVVGDIVTYTFKLGNNGPGTAQNVTFTYVIPEGLEFVSADVDQGTWDYDDTTRTLTWTLGNVTVGDPYLWLDLSVSNAGNYSIEPTITTTGYDPELSTSINSLLVSAADDSGSSSGGGSGGNGSGSSSGSMSGSGSNGSSTVHAATTTKTVPMQDTGLPISGLVSALLLVGSGLALGRKKQ